jgi:hypothetical protein
MSGELAVARLNSRPGLRCLPADAGSSPHNPISYSDANPDANSYNDTDSDAEHEPDCMPRVWLVQHRANEGNRELL